MAGLNAITRWLAVAIVVMTPACALADGLIPAVNAYRNTPTFYFIFMAVVLLESLCIRLWLKQPPFGAVLWRVVAINAASSLAGDLLWRVDWRPGPLAGDWQMILPFFVLTLLIEYPLVGVFFRGSAGSWKRGARVTLAANAISYAFLLVAEMPVEMVRVRQLEIQDERVLLGWRNPGLLAELPGVIYGTESPAGARHRLRVLDARRGTWRPMTNCPFLHPGVWDVEGNVVAFLPDGDNGVSAGGVIAVCRLPGFEPVRDIVVTNAGCGFDLWRLQLSPDTGKLAVLTRHHEVQAPLYGSTYRVLGTVCELFVFDVGSGRLLATSPRRAMNGNVCWLPDSNGVLFPSLREEQLMALEGLDRNWRRTIPDAERRFDDEPTYRFDVAAGTVALYGELPVPVLAAEGRRLAYRAGKDMVAVRDVDGGGLRSVAVGAIGGSRLVLSPEGRYALVPLTLSSPFSYLGYMTLVDLRDPARRHYLEGGGVYRLDWTTTP